MNNADTTLPMATPPISSSSGSRPQETLLQRGMFDPPVTPGTLGHLDRFEILRLLGEGGMGQVYLAREPRTDTRVAVKILRPQMADDPQSVHRFLTEARHMYRLSHPRILRVLEVSDRKEGPYYVMPYVEGGSLLGQYSPDKPMPTERILAIAGQIAEALAHAHAHGLIHRDLKPGNVLLDTDGNAYLTDFGLVRTVFNDSMVDASSSHLEGTAPYMSPAVARGEAEDTRCDIYAFGALLYELLTGQPPYTGRTPQIILDQVLKGPPPAIRTVNPKASPVLVRIAEGCMARELHARYTTMTDVVSDLARAAKGALPLGPHQQEQRRRLPRLAALLAGTLAVSGVFGLAIHYSLKLMQDRSHLAQLGGAGSPSTLPATGVAMNTHPSQVLAQANLSAATDLSHFAYTTNNGAITITRYTGPGGAVTIPSTINGLPVTGIGDYAIVDAPNLTSVTIPNSVTSIGLGLFGNCIGLKSFAVDAQNPAFSSSPEGVMFNKEKTKLVRCPGGITGDYTIPDSVTAIGDGAFGYCTSLTGITIPNSVTKIGTRSFQGCVRLTKVTIPKSVASIGENPFPACSGLISVDVDAANPTFSSSVDGVWFDKQKTRLVCYPAGKNGSYEIPNSVTVIGAGAFFVACTNLTNVTIPSSVRVIDNWAFFQCAGLTSVTIPDSVSSIGQQAFFGCTSLTSVHFKGGAPRVDSDIFLNSNQATIYYQPDTKGWGKEFGGRPTAVWDPETPFTYTVTNGAITITKYTGPGGNVEIPRTINSLPVTSIGDRAFGLCKSLNRVTIPNTVINIGWQSFVGTGLISVTIPDSVISIGQQAFDNSSLTSVTIANSVTSIGFWAFNNCKSLTSVQIPDGVASIADGAFAGCMSLPAITVSAQNPAFFSRAGVLFNKDQTTLIQYPAGKRDSSYMIHDTVTNIKPYAFSGCSHLTSITASKQNSAYSSVGGVLFNRDLTMLIAYPPGDNGGYTIPVRVTSIGPFAFSGRNLTRVTIPNSVTGIGPDAFSFCKNLACVTIPDSVTNIGTSGFNGCINLTNVTISSSMTSIGRDAFSYCDNLTAVYFKGDAPMSDGDVLTGSNKATVYYPAGAKGWGPTFGGRPTAVWDGAMQSPFAYTTNNGAITITQYTGPGGAVTIPSTINGLPVTGIGDYAFWGCASLTGVSIPASITSLSDSSFISAWPEGHRLLRIVVDAANPAYCSTSDGVVFTKDKTCLVSYPSAKAGDYVIPKGVASIGDRAFYGSASLTSVTIPNSVTRIGSHAFVGCAGLTDVTIPASVTSVGISPFRAAYQIVGKLLSITVDPANPAYCSSADGVLFTKDKTCLINYPYGRAGAYVIPNSVTNIGLMAFQGCWGLTRLAIPASVTSIPDNPLIGSWLTSIIVDEANPAYSSSADGVLFNKQKTCLVSYPSGKTGSYVIPEGVTHIGAHAFHYCTNLTSVTIPNSVASIGGCAFLTCSGLASVYFKGNAPSSVSDSSVFISADKATVYYQPGTTGWGKEFGGRPTAVWNQDESPYTYTVTNGAITITQYTGPGGDVTIPSTINGLPVTGIGSDAFKGCTNVTSVTFPNSVTGIGKDAFAGCSGLTNITIPSSITSITGNPFPSCSRLLSIFVDASNPSYSSNADGVVFDKKMDCLLICPGGKAGSYEIPNPVTRIGVCAFNSCTKLTNVTIPDGVTKIEGCAFWCCVALTNVMIGSGVSIIEGGAFGYCHSLTRVTLPASVISIEGNSFYDSRVMSSILVDPENPSYSCSVDGVLFNKEKTSLVCYPGGKAGSYVIPNSVKRIMRGAFGGGPNLTSVAIPSSVTSIGAQAFAGCARLTNITLPNSITSIEFQAFWGCAGLTGVTLPKSVTSIEGGAFAACSGLVSIEVEAANPAFSSKDGIVFDKENSTLVCYPRGRTGSYDIPSSVKNIGNSAFGACPNLTSVTVPASLTNIGYWAFGQCPNLTAIYFNGNAPRLDMEVFLDCTKATVYYLSDTKGWGKEFGGRPTAVWTK